MKILSLKKIFSFSLAFLVFPFLLSAQTSSQVNNVITDIQWLPPPYISSTSLGLSGTVSTNGSNDPYGFLLEWGIPESWSTVSGQVQITQNPSLPGPFFGAPLRPADHLNPQNQFIEIYANDLWPSQYYYFDIRETNVMANASAIPTDQQPLLDYYINRTARPEAGVLTLTLSPYSNGNVTLQGQFNTNSASGTGTLSGMPIAVYLTPAAVTEPNPASGIPPDFSSATFAQTVLVGSNDRFSINLTGLAYNQDYYLTLVNDRSDLFLDDSTLLNFNDTNSSNGTTPGNGSTNGGLLNPGQLTTTQSFASGLITCDGVDTECNFEKLILMINRVINFFIYIIAGPIIALSFAYAGFLMVTSGGNPSKKDEAKSIVGKALVGFIFLLAAWLIVKTILVVFGYSGPLFALLGI